MNRWVDLNIPLPERKNFIGERISMSKILNKDVEIIDYKIEDSKKCEGGKCLTLQLRFAGESRVLFTGARFLIKQIEKVEKNNLPVVVCIVKQEDGSYLFT
ncbi:MAG: hypothetical protein M0R37_13050 [Bacteroidales bacterium]|nr:hypothetical protein [Bacteroidales bacterium]